MFLPSNTLLLRLTSSIPRRPSGLPPVCIFLGIPQRQFPGQVRPEFQHDNLLAAGFVSAYQLPFWNLEGIRRGSQGRAEPKSPAAKAKARQRPVPELLWKRKASPFMVLVVLLTNIE